MVRKKLNAKVRRAIISANEEVPQRISKEKEEYVIDRIDNFSKKPHYIRLFWQTKDRHTMDKI